MRSKSIGTLTVIGLIVGAGAALRVSFVPAASAGSDPYESYRARSSVSLGVIVRDFDESHPDFGLYAADGQGRYAAIPSETLDVNGRPVMATTGRKVTADWTDALGNPIMRPVPYIEPAPGGTAGSMSTTDGGAVTSSQTFGQWFRPVAGVNTEHRSSMVLTRTGNTYVFDGSLDAFAGHNDFDYTAAIDTTFIHDSGKDWYINVATGAEVFVYIDGKLVIDGGGGLGSDSSDRGLVGGHFDVDVFNGPTDKQKYHKHEYDDEYDVTWVDIANDDRLLLDDLVPLNYPNPLRVQFFNTDNGGWGIYSFAAGSDQASDWVMEGLDRVFIRSELTQLRIDFRELALMAHTTPKDSQKDVANRAGAFSVRIYDTVTSKMIYELTVYHHGAPPAGYEQLREDYMAGAVHGRGMPAMTQRIDLSRLPWLEDGRTHELKVFFANRTGAPSNFRFETNIDTLDLVALPQVSQVD